MAGLRSVEVANRWLRGTDRAEHNARFAVEPAEANAAFVPFVGDLSTILCIQEERTVGHDNTVRYGGRVLQIPEQTHRRHFVRATVRVHEQPDGVLAIFYGPRLLARYDPDGALVPSTTLTRSAA